MSKPAKPSTKAARLAAALRENLKRRKAQERGREASCSAEPGTSGGMKQPADRSGDGAPLAHDSAGIGADKRKA